MKTRLTMRDVARAAGVSPMTVSRALRGDRTVAEATRKAVSEIAAGLGYVYDTTAQAFRAQKSGFVAVTLPSINNSNFAETHRGLTDTLSETGLQILLGCTNYSAAQEERIVRQLLERQPEALVLTGSHHSQATQTLLRSRDMPIVEIWDQPHAPIQHSVGFSNGDAMTPLVEQLAAKGRRRLAFLGAEGVGDHRGAARRDGVVAAARQLGLPDVRVLEIGAAPVSMTEGARAVADLGAAIDGFDALVCVSDMVAFGALAECQRRGIAIPDQLAITGFGAFEIASLSCPRLTTVDVFDYGIGVATGHLIARLLQSDDAGIPAHTDTGSKLRLGETS